VNTLVAGTFKGVDVTHLVSFSKVGAGEGEALFCANKLRAVISAFIVENYGSVWLSEFQLFT
jgi:hypothetical protein